MDCKISYVTITVLLFRTTTLTMGWGSSCFSNIFTHQLNCFQFNEIKIRCTKSLEIWAFSRVSIYKTEMRQIESHFQSFNFILLVLNANSKQIAWLFAYTCLYFCLCFSLTSYFHFAVVIAISISIPDKQYTPAMKRCTLSGNNANLFEGLC